MRLATSVNHTVVVGVAVVAGLAVVGGGVAVATRHSASGSQHVAARDGHVPRAHLALHGMSRHHQVTYSKRLHFTVKNGAFSAVSVADSEGTAVAGTFNAARTSWRSVGSFVPLTELTGSVSYVDEAHRTTTRHIRLKTTDSKQHLTAILSPGGGDTVGVGSPIVVTFDHPVPQSKRAAVEHDMSVTTTPSAVGAWHWMSDMEVHWRPPTYWKPGTKVTLTSDLSQLQLSKDMWGAPGKHSTSFKIGPAHLSIANAATHEMSVYSNGKLLRTMPISAGSPTYPTKDGVHITFEKSPQVVMDSATVGIPKGSAGYYHETVFWDVRISYGGAFVHAAPWSVAQQGVTNVSHGCINLSPANAQWFYGFALRGDIVDVVNSSAPVNQADPGMADWNMSWKQWVAGDAAPTRAAKRRQPPLPHDTEPGFAPVKHHSHHRHHAGAHHSATHTSKHHKHKASSSSR